MQNILTLLFVFIPVNIVLAQAKNEAINTAAFLLAKLFLVFLFIVVLSSFTIIYYLHKFLQHYKYSPITKYLFLVILFIWLNIVIMIGICTFTIIFLNSSESIVNDDITLTTIPILTVIFSLLLMPRIYHFFFSDKSK